MSLKKPNINKNKDRERRLMARSSSSSHPSYWPCQWSVFTYWVLLRPVSKPVKIPLKGKQNLVIKHRAAYVLIKIFKIMYRQMNKKQIPMMRARRNTPQWMLSSAYPSILWISWSEQWIYAINSSESTVLVFFFTKDTTFHVLSWLISASDFDSGKGEDKH